MESLKLSDLLNRIRQHEQTQGAVTPPLGLDVPRARALVLDSSLWTPEERELVKRDMRSRQLVERMAQAIPRISWWELAAYALGRLTGPRARTVKYLCLDHAIYRQRLQALEALRDRAICLTKVFAVPSPGLALAGASGTEVEAHELESRDHTLRADLFEDSAGRVIVEVRTHDASYHGKLVGVVLRSGSGQKVLTRYLVLARQKLNDWHAGHVALDRATLHRELGGRIECLEVVPLEASLLSSDDAAGLTASVEATRDDQHQRSAWKHWLESNSVEPLLAQKLDEVRTVL